MPHKTLLTQVMNTNKSAFDNSFNAMAALQDQAEKMTKLFLDQAAWMPAEGKQAIQQWTEGCKQARESYRAAVEAGYRKLAEHLAAIK
ncbi:MAG: hypothetical protein ACYDA8_01395 [Deferrisomatales bacterium]